MIEVNYFLDHKNEQIVVTSSIYYLKTINKISKDIQKDKKEKIFIKDSDFKKMKKDTTSSWLLHSKKIDMVEEIKGQKFSCYLCVFSILGKDDKPFSIELLVPSFAFSYFDISSTGSRDTLGKLSSII